LKPPEQEPFELPQSPQAHREAEAFIAGEAQAKRKKFFREYFEWLESLTAAVVITVLIFTFVGRVATVSGSSMFPTLQDGNMLLLSDLFYQPAYGDIVIITQPHSPQEPLIKRIIATEGQQVYIDFALGEVYVDGELLDEPYICEPTYQDFDVTFPQVVPAGHVFVMGDNRNNSLDSRVSRIGMIDERNILGKVYCRISPMDEFGRVE